MSELGVVMAAINIQVDSSPFLTEKYSSICLCVRVHSISLSRCCRYLRAYVHRNKQYHSFALSMSTLPFDLQFFN